MVSRSLILQTVVVLLSVHGVVGARNGGRHGRRRKEQIGGSNNNNNKGKHNNARESDKQEPVSMREYVHHQKKQSVYCFQCAYSPDKDVYQTIKAPSIVKDKRGRTRLAYKTRLMKVRKQGGWDKCVGPFDNSKAHEYGIDVKACDNTCYARLEKSGNIFRGCYQGAYDVDQYKYGCHEQQGSIWCFCKGHVCNNNEILGTQGESSGNSTVTPEPDFYRELSTIKSAVKSTVKSSVHRNHRYRNRARFIRRYPSHKSYVAHSIN